MNCVLCSDDLSPILDASTFWRLAIGSGALDLQAVLIHARRLQSGPAAPS